MNPQATGRRFTIYTDGGARGNPGPAAIGVVILEDSETLATYGKVVGRTLTNNQAEYLAVEDALHRAQALGGTDIEIRLDSELVASQLRGEYKIKNPELGKIFLRIWNLIQQFHRVKFVTIPRTRNTLADIQVNKALDQSGLSMA